MKSPLLKSVAPYKLAMAGKGAPQPTLFGVIGETKRSPMDRSLGGLVKKSGKGKMPDHERLGKGMRSEHGAVSLPAPKTHIPPAHYAQIPYPGEYMSKVGAALS